MRITTIALVAISAVLLLGPPKAVAQNDAWIDEARPYLKMSVAEDGFYRIDYEDLVNQGLPASQFNSEAFRLWHLGKEKPLLVQDGDDGQLDPGDYLGFYGIRNTDTLDHPLFIEGPSPNRAPVSLFSDSSYYFLALGGSGRGLRYRFRDYQSISGIPERTSARFSANFLMDRDPPANRKSYTTPYRNNINELQNTYYYTGEGWFSTPILERQAQEYTLALPVPIEREARLVVKLMGITNFLDSLGQRPTHNHFPQIFARDSTGSNQLLLSARFLGPQTRFYELPLEEAFHGLSQLRVRLSHPNIGYFDGVAFITGNLQLLYEGSLQWDGQRPLSFRVPATTSQERLRVAEEEGDAPQQPWLVSPDEGLIYRPDDQNDDQQQYLVSPNPARRDFLLADAQQLPSPRFYTYRSIPKAAEFLPTNLDYLIVTHPSLEPSAEAYRSFRQSTGLNTEIVYTPDLFDRFYYGHPHPQAITAFARRFYGERGLRPDYVFLLGKGYATDNLQGFAETVENKVPTYGSPPSDLMLFRGLVPNQLNPPFAVGRLSAQTNEQVFNYLNKVRAYETQEAIGWRKNIIHISGGLSEEESIRLKNNIESIAPLIEEPHYGARINSYRNFSTQLGDETAEKQVLRQVNEEGVGLINYLGHGAASSFEVSIGDDDVPANYANADRLLQFYVSGCIMGNTYQRSSAIADDYLFTPEIGAVTWVSGTSFGYVSYLRRLAQEVYRQMSEERYGASYGQILRNANNRFQEIGDFSNEMTVLQNAFNGDPAITLFDAPLPDYTFSTDSFRIGPNNVTTQSDSFTLYYGLRNLGKALEQDTLTVRLNHTTLAGFRREVYDTVIAPFYGKSYALTMPAADPRLQGLNRFELNIDPEAREEELERANNSAVFEYFFFSTGATPLSPREYGIADSAFVALEAQANTPDASTPPTLFEIDTTPAFSSPWRKRSPAIESVNQRGLIEWQVELLPRDSQTYHWRVRTIDAAGDSSEWAPSSFTRIEGSAPGFAQNDAAQKSTAISDNMVVDGESSLFSFPRSQDEVKYNITVSGPQANNTSALIRVAANNFQPISRAFVTRNRSEGLNVFAFNARNLNRFSYNSRYNDKLWSFAVVNESPVPPANNYSGQFYFDYIQDDSTLNATVVDSLVAHLERIPDDHHVIVFPEEYHRVADLPRVTALLNQWLENPPGLEDLQANQPFIMVGRTGKPAEGDTYYEAAAPGDLDARFSFPFDAAPLRQRGRVRSVPIGPATQWGEVDYRTRLKDSPADSNHLSLFGITPEGEEEVIFEERSERRISIAEVDPLEYPQLRLEMYLQDTAQYTPEQLASWVVTYQGLPDGSWRPDLLFSFRDDTLQEGETLAFEIAFGNISDVPLDSMAIEVGLFNQNGVAVEEVAFRRDSLLPNDTFELRFERSTNELSGEYSLRAVVSSLSPLGEQYTFNNQFSREFFVAEDQVEPVVDVFVDGRKIADQEIVSPSPQVEVRLRDENPYIKLDESQAFNVSLERPASNSFEPLTADRSDVTFVPAESTEDNSALLRWTPESKLSDGVYTLRASAEDASGNKTGGEPYEVSFEVINESTITHFYPYPNPFSEQTRFIFTLTGSEIPDFIKIQIMTVSGKVVREITQEELGPLHIGTNVSQFAWDGRDQFGNVLGNGVYFYRVFAYIEGEPVEMRETAGDRFFERGIGKMYIAR